MLPPVEKLRAPVMGVCLSHATLGSLRLEYTHPHVKADTGPYTTATMRCTIKRFPFLKDDLQWIYG